MQGKLYHLDPMKDLFSYLTLYLALWYDFQRFLILCIFSWDVLSFEDGSQKTDHSTSSPSSETTWNYQNKDWICWRRLWLKARLKWRILTSSYLSSTSKISSTTLTSWSRPSSSFSFSNSSSPFLSSSVPIQERQLTTFNLNSLTLLVT